MSSAADREKHPLVDCQSVSHNALDQIFKKRAALRIIAKLIEARAGRRQQHDIAGAGMRGGITHGRSKIVDHHRLREMA